MKVLNLDVRSLVIGFLLAMVALLVFKGFPSQAQTGSNYMISAGDGGVYILRDNQVIFRDKRDCEKQLCQF